MTSVNSGHVAGRGEREELRLEKVCAKAPPIYWVSLGVSLGREIRRWRDRNVQHGNANIIY